METIKKLVDAGADSDLVDNNGQTPLFYAIKNGKLDVVEYLAERGANVNVIDKKNITPVSWAKRLNK